jgi:hypothetical protein
MKVAIMTKIITLPAHTCSQAHEHKKESFYHTITQDCTTRLSRGLARNNLKGRSLFLSKHYCWKLPECLSGQQFLGEVIMIPCKCRSEDQQKKNKEISDVIWFIFMNMCEAFVHDIWKGIFHLGLFL